MPRTSLHGVPITWSLEGPAPDPLAELLGPLGDLQLNDEPPSPRAIKLTLRAADHNVALRPDAERYAPLFFLGIVQAYTAADRTSFLLWDRASRVEIPLDGSPISAWIAPPEREIASGSAAAMIQIALSVTLRREGLFHLHAAALELSSGAGVVVAGGSGAGKTTTAIALIESGAMYLGDDSVFLRARPGQGRDGGEVLAFPRDFHAGTATLQAFPRLAAFAEARVGQPEKLAIDPRRAFPGRALHATKLPDLLLFPSVSRSASRTEIAPLSKAEAFGQLLGASAAILLEGFPARDENISLLRRMAEAAESFELHLGADAITDPIAAIAQVVAKS